MTDEQRIRGADRDVDSAIIITGYDGGAVAECAKGLCADRRLSSHGAREATSAIYATSYALAASEFDA